MSHLLTPDGNYVGSYPLPWGTFTRVAILSMTPCNEGSLQARGEHVRMRLGRAFVELHPRMKWIATRT